MSNVEEYSLIVIFGPSIVTQSITIIKKKITFCSPCATLKAMSFMGHAKQTII